MGRTFVTTDIHGCVSEFNKLIYLLKLTAKDTLIVIGDCLHKHPNPSNSVRIVQTLYLLQQDCNVVLVAGNHEEKQLRWANAELKAQALGALNPVRYAEGFAEIQAGLIARPGLLDFVEQARLYYQTEGFLILHGGMPSACNLPPDVTLKELFSMTGKQRDFCKQVLWTRYVNPQGYPVALGTESPDDRYWADIYDGSLGTILFGHQPFIEDQVRVFPHAVGLDLGCVFGNLLAAVQIQDGIIVEKFYVKAQQKYAKSYYED